MDDAVDEPSPLLRPDDRESEEQQQQQQQRSTHGPVMKALFAWAQFSPLVAIITVGATQPIFALKYRVDISTLATLGGVLGVSTLFVDLAIGYLQDKELFVFRPGCFSKERWGRRAPWFILHSPILALFMGLAWAPPSLDKNFLVAWYFICMFVCTWSWEHIIIAAKAGAVECCE